jgi:hypothetical protein
LANAGPFARPAVTIGVDIVNYAAIVDASQQRLIHLNADTTVVIDANASTCLKVDTINVALTSLYCICSRLVPPVRQMAAAAPQMRYETTAFSTERKRQNASPFAR